MVRNIRTCTYTKLSSLTLIIIKDVYVDTFFGDVTYNVV